jgi:MoaA/NifB/PqqE/SkfB family radical SAM enzyme
LANLLITNHCPRQCTFCFARTKIGTDGNRQTTRQMTLDQIRMIMDFLERSDDKNLRLLGGEPTTHPRLKEIVTEAMDRGFDVHLFSNCMMSKSTADFLATHSPKRLSILANVSPQARDTRKQKEQVAYALQKLGPRVQLGITLTSPDFEYAFLIDTIDKYGLKRHIRIGIAQPIVGTANEYLAPSEYRQTGRQITKMVQVCFEHDILIRFDCGLTLCMFSEEEIGILGKRSEGFKAVCRPIIDIGPNLDIWHCFPLSEVLNTRLEKFTSRKQAHRFYEALTMPYRTFGCLPECLECGYLRRGQCTGGCLSHAMNSLNKLPPEFFKEI